MPYIFLLSSIFSSMYSKLHNPMAAWNSFILALIPMSETSSFVSIPKLRKDLISCCIIALFAIIPPPSMVWNVQDHEKRGRSWLPWLTKCPNWVRGLIELIITPSYRKTDMLTVIILKFNTSPNESNWKLKYYCIFYSLCYFALN